VLALLGSALSLLLPHLAAIVAGWSRLRAGATAGTSCRTLVRAAGGARRRSARADHAHDGRDAHARSSAPRAGGRARSGWQIARLYGANTSGAAAGALLDRFRPRAARGLQAHAVSRSRLNSSAAALAVWRFAARRRTRTAVRRASERAAERPAGARARVALALPVLRAMGLEMLWLRHFSILLGGFRAVFSLVLRCVLVAGARRACRRLAAAAMRAGRADLLVAACAILAVSTLAGWRGPAPTRWRARRDGGRDAGVARAGSPRARRDLVQPAADARRGRAAGVLRGHVVSAGQRARAASVGTVGPRAGLLYLANTAGAVCGSLAAGYLLLPRLGMQAPRGAGAAGAAAIVPLLARRRVARPRVRGGAVAVAALGAWTLLPSDFVLQRASRGAGDRVLTTSEGTTEVIAVVEARAAGAPDQRPRDVVHGLLDQRYMRALAHVPLLSMARRAACW
jgi:spermidine synthase